MIHRILLFICCAVGITTAQAQLQEGDIILQRIPCGNLCDAIVETTPCKTFAYNHCGIVHYEKGKPFVIEAMGEQVQQTPLDSFAKREQTPTYHIARLKAPYKRYIQQAVKAAQAYIGTPYDDAFLPGDSALYCSELVWAAFKDGNRHPIFALQPMTFISPRTHTTYPAWEAYYTDLGIAIPEGEPGINPCAIANAEVVELLMIK